MAKALNKNTAQAAKGFGGNVPPETARTLYADYVSYKKDEERAQAEAKTAQSTTRSFLKTVKKSGIDPDHFIFLYKESKRDPAEVALEHKQRESLREMLNMQINTGDLFGKDDQSFGAGLTNGPDDRALHAGAMACTNGETMDSNPHPVGSEAYNLWKKGFEDELADRLSGASSNGKAGKTKAGAGKSATGKASTKKKAAAGGEAEALH